MNIKLILRIIEYLILAPFDTLGIIVAYLLNPIVVLFANDDGWLPPYPPFKWFQTFDASLDTGWQDGKWTGIWDGRYRYLARVRWLYRNPAYGWSYYVLGCEFIPAKWTLVKWTYRVFYARSEDGHFCFKYTFLPSGTWFKFGWKAENMHDPESPTGWSLEPWGSEWRIPIVTSTNITHRNK